MRRAFLMFRQIFSFRLMFFYIGKLIDLFFYKRGKTGSPIRLQIELVSWCNLKCDFCILSELEREKKLMSFESFKKIIDEANAKYLQLSGIGETFLHPEIDKIMHYAKSRGCFVKITTNGLPINEKWARAIVDSGIDMLDVSIDTTDPELYKKIRGANFSKVIGNVKMVYDYRNEKKSKLKIRAKNIYNENNIHNLPDDLKNITQLPFDTILLDWVVDMYEGSTHKTVNKEYNKTLDKAIETAHSINRPDMANAVKILKATIYKKDRPDKVCYEPFYAPYITVDGEITPCCKAGMWILQKDENMKTFSFGNILNNKFNEVWNGEKAVSIRNNVLSNRNKFGYCKSCIFDENSLFRAIYKTSSTIIYRK